MEQSELAEMLQPFGLYNRRSKNIKSVCLDLINEHGGKVPHDREELLEISGIGEYVADAVRCFAYSEPVILLDTNVIRVAEHYFGIQPPSDPRLDDEIQPTLRPLVPDNQPKEFNWALIDLGNKLAGDGPPPLDL